VIRRCRLRREADAASRGFENIRSESRALLSRRLDYRALHVGQVAAASAFSEPDRSSIILESYARAFVRVDESELRAWRGFFRVGSSVSRYSLNERLDEADLPDYGLCNHRRGALSAYLFRIRGRIAGRSPEIRHGQLASSSKRERESSRENCSVLFQTRRTRRPVEGVARPPLPCWVHGPWMSPRTGSL